MTLKEIREMETKNIQDRLADARDKVRELRFGLVNRQVKNIREIRTLKNEIAHLLTILNERRTAAGTSKMNEKK